MYVVLAEDFDPESHTVWGPFETQQLASEWAENNTEELGEMYSIQPIVRPINPDVEFADQRENANV